MARIGRAQAARWTWPATLAGLVLAIQLLLGAWVAGLDAGHASDSWPLMQGRLVPEFDGSRGFLHAATHDPFLIHFLHRWWAWIAVAALVWFARRVRPLERKASVAIHSAFGTQILLGIAVVVMGMPCGGCFAQFVARCWSVIRVPHVLGRTAGPWAVRSFALACADLVRPDEPAAREGRHCSANAYRLRQFVP